MNTEIKLEECNNELLKKKFYDIIKNNTNESLNILKELCYLIDLKSKIYDTDLLTISIYCKNKISFDILIERGININEIMNYGGINRGMTPILWALNTNDKYFIEKLLNRVELNLFCKTEYNINVITYLCEIIVDINIFETVLNKMKDISFERTEKYILEMPKLFIEYCIICYNNNKDKNLLFDKLQILFNYSENIVKKISLKYFYEDYIIKYSLKNIMVELYNFLKEKLDCILVEYPIITSSVLGSLELIKIFHNEGYSLNEYKMLTPLNIALKNNNIEIINYLIDNNVDVLLSNKNYDNLYYSIINDNLDIFKYISKYFNIFKEYDNYIYSLNLPKYHRPIHIAFAHKALNIILYLRDQGEDYMYNGNASLTPLEVGISNYITTIEISTLTMEYKTMNEIYKGNKYSSCDECCICLDNMYNQEMIKLNCGHIFHKKCLLKNIINSHKCPYCRNNIIIDSYIYNNLGIVKNKKKITKKKRTKSVSIYDKESRKELVYSDDTNIDSLDIELYNQDYFDKEWGKKFNKLKEELENNDKKRKLILLRELLMDCKNIHKKNKIVCKYTTPPPTPIRKKRVYKTEVMKLKEIYCNMENNISYPRKTRNKQPDRYGF